MKKTKVFLALLLAMAMVLSMVACGGSSAGKDTEPAGTDASADDTTAAADDTTAAADDGEDLSWLNLGGTYPIVAEGVEKTLSICLPVDDQIVDSYEDNFQYRFVVEQMNINLDVQPVPSSAWSEKLPLILADVDNLPDIILNARFSTSQMLRYGTEEGLLLDLAPYINEQYMPLLSAFFAKYPQYKSIWTDADGHIYSFNLINNTDTVNAQHWFHLNYQWMKDCGLDPMTDLPETLDEFTDLMRLFKKVKSAEFGEEIYPIAGKYDTWNGPFSYLLVACGFVGAHGSDPSFPGGVISMRNGEVTLPVADREGYEGFVKTLKLWYDEGLIHPEFFTGEASALDALIASEKVGYTAVPPHVWINPETVAAEWWGAPLLTSQWCDEPGVPSNASANGVGTHVITTACEELELALAFFDFFYEQTNDPSTQNYYWMTHGAYEGTPEAELYPDYVLARNFGKYSYEHICPEKYNGDVLTMLLEEVTLWGNVCLGLNFIENEEGTPVLEEADDVYEMMLKYEGKGVESYAVEYPRSREHFITHMMKYAFCRQYQVAPNEEFPAVVHLDAATQERANELKISLKEFAITETAKFITGQRDIAELPDYFDEIEALGATEYVQIYADYFAAVNG